MGFLNNPLLSVVIPVYNVEAYLRDTLESVIVQDIGFEKNIEIIIVNDGSTDGSEKICEEYREKFPENIKYYTQKNSGVSAARNNGISHARGEYITFLDADDIWKRDAFRKSIKFLQKHKEDVDFVCSKILFFDSDTSRHPSNYKFYKTRVLNIDNEPDSPLYHVITCVFKRSAIQNIRFDEKLKITEDGKFISEVLLNKRAYGVLSDTCYYYRKRNDQSSAIGGKLKNKDYYTVVPERAYLTMMADWTDTKGDLSPFIQYEIISDLAWRLEEKAQTILSSIEENEYRERIKSIINQFDTNVILGKKNIPLYLKLYMLKLKYGEQEYNARLNVKGGHVFYENKHLYSLENQLVVIEFINKIDDEKYLIEGYVDPAYTTEALEYNALSGERRSSINWMPRVQREKSFLEDVTYTGGAFEVEITADDLERHGLEFEVASQGKRISKLLVKFDVFSKFSSLKFSYKQVGGILLKTHKYGIRIHRSTIARKVLYELIFMARVIADWRIIDSARKAVQVTRKNLRFISLSRKIKELIKPIGFVIESVITIPRDIFIRCLYHLTHASYRSKQLWLISDRPMAAGDSGEVFFKYIQEHYADEIEAVFVLSKSSADYKRVRGIGKIIHQGGFKHRLLMLHAKKVISSHADIEVTNPYFRQRSRFADLLNFQFVFLQHGIIRHDVSDWLNRFSSGIDLFIVSAEAEYQSLFDNPYYFRSGQVTLSGLPRFDMLVSEPKNKIILAPTYRKALLKSNTDRYGARRYDETFTSSEYFKFFSAFMNDVRVKEAMQVNGLTGELYIHPNFAAQAKDFKENELFKIAPYPHDYQLAFKEGSLLITDYSSVVFDFAYLKKPVIYTQFDRSFVFSSSVYKEADFYSDEKDGFGPVTYTYDDLVSETLALIDSGCVMKSEYQERVDTFFKWKDKNNCKRVYESVIKMRPSLGV